jgi:signal transduction histidine kinase
MRLPDFILANTEPILAEWETFARGIWPGSATDPTTLRDHAAQMLYAAVADMRSDQTRVQQSDKSKGDGGDGPDAARVNRASEAHGVDRMTSGFDLAALIAEYRALRASVIRLWRESEPVSDLNDLYDITRFNESIDQSLTEAVLAYTRHVEGDRAAALEEQGRQGRELRGLNEALLVSSVRQHELIEQAGHAASALREAKEQAESANRAKDRFLAVLSHELRTPLTPVAMAATAMEMDARLPFECREDAAMIRRNIDLETRLIDDLLDLSRVTSGKLRLNVQPTGIHRLIQYVLDTVGPELHEKQLTVERQLTAAKDLVEADPARLQQTLWNLLKNSAKFTPSGGRVVVRTRNEADRLVIEVGDNGKGITADVLPRVFDPFEQGATDVTQRYGGMGLGLAIAKAIMDLHGGTISARSDGEGKGAVFAVALPLSAAAPLVVAPTADEPAEASKRPVRVLLVEDHADTAKMLVRLLRMDGSEVRWAGTVAAALEAAAAEPFDVVVSDLGLPDGSGHDLIRRLLRDRPVLGIAMSGYGMEDDIRQSREAGFVEHLVKPVSLPQLREAIRRVANTIAN